MTRREENAPADYCEVLNEPKAALAQSWFITLLHRDICDKAEERRLKMSLNALIVEGICSSSVI